MRNQTSMPSPISPSGTSTAYCSPSDLSATVSLSPAAGNIYGTFTLTNTSSTTCLILGGQFISAQFDTGKVKNITITHTGQTQPEAFAVQPHQSLYSQVHYPNGPQCQSVGLNQTPVTFSYNISPTNTVSFIDQAGKKEQIVQTCTSLSDKTEVTIWQLSPSPITPQ